MDCLTTPTAKQTPATYHEMVHLKTKLFFFSLINEISTELVNGMNTKHGLGLIITHGQMRLIF